MRINSIGNFGLANQRTQRKQQSFGNAYVTLAKANLADIISRNVDTYNNGDFIKMYDSSRESAQRTIDRVNETLKNSTREISTVDDLTDKVDLYVLAAGSGSRFSKFAKAVADLRGKGESFNKISVPFELGKGQAPLTMLDIPLAMGRFFAPKTGYEKIVAEQPSGSFGDIIKNYIDVSNNASLKRSPRDVVVCCGDNVFHAKGEDMLSYLVRTINDPDKQLGVVGVARKPDEVAGKFGVLEVGKQNPESGLYPLVGFVEKPPIEVAQSLVTPEGVNIANTGMFVIKKDSMANLLGIIQGELRSPEGKSTCIAKNEKEPFDFANATKWTRTVNGTDASDVLLVDTWEDVGEKEAYLNWLKDVREGKYTDNFTPERRQAIIEAAKDRVSGNTIQFTIDGKGEEKLDDIIVKA